MDFRKATSLLILACLGAVLVCSAGCLVGGSRTARVKGDVLAERHLDVHAEGQTTGEDIIAAFGKPTQHLKMAGGKELLTYVSERTDSTRFHILFIFGWKSNTERTIRHNFELKDGILARYWKEEF